MDKVFACIDGTPGTTGVCDYAAWAAMRLDLPLEFLHVIDRHPEKAAVRDLSGSIGLGAQDSLLHELTTVDEQRSKLAQEHGRQLLEGAKRRAATAGAVRVDGRQRHGSLEDTVLDMEPGARLFVLGQHRHGESLARRHLDHNVERVIRAVHRPVLVASQEFRRPQRFAIAFDGGATGRTIVETVARGAMLRGLPCHVVMAAEATAATHDQTSWARAALTTAGFDVTVATIPGHPEAVLHDYIAAHDISILVMGAYGHSRIRQLIVGSTTTTMLRASPAPVLILR